MKRKMLRPGYTLLEVLLALGIGVLLLAGLYVSMEVQVRLAQGGRERVDEAVVARAVLARITADVQTALTPIRATTSGTGFSAAPTGGTATSDSSSTSSLNAVTPCNGGVGGDVDRLTLYCSRVPGAGRTSAEIESAPNGGSDIRRITYWLVPDQGLARQEISRVTADDEATQLPPDVSDPMPLVIAPEVTDLKFQYYDGAAWQDQWDGSSTSDDGSTPMGPPRAVKIVLSVTSPANHDRVRTYTHVVAVQSANAQPPAPTTEAAP